MGEDHEELDNPFEAMNRDGVSGNEASERLLGGFQQAMDGFMSAYSQDEMDREHRWNVIAVSVALDNALAMLRGGISGLPDGAHVMALPMGELPELLKAMSESDDPQKAIEEFNRKRQERGEPEINVPDYLPEDLMRDTDDGPRH